MSKKEIITMLEKKQHALEKKKEGIEEELIKISGEIVFWNNDKLTKDNHT